MSSSVNKVKNSLLFLTQTLDELKPNIKHLLEESFKHTNENLYVYINPLVLKTENQSPLQINNQLQTPKFLTDKFKLKHLLHSFYQKSYKLNPRINLLCLLNNVHGVATKSNLNYDIILTDLSKSSPVYESLPEFCNSFIPNGKAGDSTTPMYSIKCYDGENSGIEPSRDKSLFPNDQILAEKVYQNTIMGGTFDRLHIGHKIMLSEAALLTQNRLLVGVTNECMLGRKKLSELIETFDTRSANVVKFLNTVASSLDILPVDISDPYGPSIVERDYQCLVVSQETFKTGEMVNLKRSENNLPPLEIHVVDLIKDEDLVAGDEEKVSSSNERRRLLGSLLKKPYIEYNSSKPYVIGLTGGLASGKSTIRKDLEEMGAATIDCDKLGHMAYERGTHAYEKIIQTFGDEILDSNGLICRKKLGGIVFNNPDKLKNLTDIVWPEIHKLVDENVERLFKEGNEIIVVEAALLIDAKWYESMNEIWVSFLPDEEAIKRSVARDNSNIDKVKGILSAQMKNKDRIAKANVVFSSLWEREYTIGQVKKAWTSLKKRTVDLKNSVSSKI